MQMRTLSFSTFDLILFVVILFFIVRCSIKGFVDEFFSKTAVLGGIAAAILFFRRLSPAVAELTGKDSLSGILAFLMIFLVVYFVIKIIQRVINGAFHNVSMRNLDRALGFFLGIGEGILVSLVVVIVIDQQPFFDPSALFSGSLFVRLFAPFMDFDLRTAAPEMLNGIL